MKNMKLVAAVEKKIKANYIRDLKVIPGRHNDVMIFGNTYQNKDFIKEIGGRWNAPVHCWEITEESFKEW